MIGTEPNTLALLLRNQFSTLRSVGVSLALDEDRQRRMLLVPEREWSAWSNFLRDGPLPAHPSAPTMLRRLGAATYRLAALWPGGGQPRLIHNGPRKRSVVTPERLPSTRGL